MVQWSVPQQPHRSGERITLLSHPLHAAILLLSGRREGGVAAAAMMEESLQPVVHRNNNHRFLQLDVC